MCTNRFCRIGRAKPRNPAGIFAHTNHQPTDRIFTQPGSEAEIQTAPLPDFVLRVLRCEPVWSARDGETCTAFPPRWWRAGLGWYVVGKAGQLLERSIVDRAVCAAERLVFEANPELEPPLAQEKREATIHDGAPLDTRAACADLSGAEAAELKRRNPESQFRGAPRRRISVCPDDYRRNKTMASKRFPEQPHPAALWR